MDLNMTTLNNIYTDTPDACLQAVLDFYTANKCYTILTDKSLETLMEIFNSGCRGYARKAKPAPLDLLVLTRKDGAPHLAVYLGHGKIAHLYRGRLVVRRLTGYIPALTGVFDVLCR